MMRNIKRRIERLEQTHVGQKRISPVVHKNEDGTLEHEGRCYQSLSDLPKPPIKPFWIILPRKGQGWV